MRKKSKPYIRYTHYAPARFHDAETGTNLLYHNKSMRNDLYPNRDWFKAVRRSKFMGPTLSRQLYGRVPYRNPLMIKPVVDKALYYAEEAAQLAKAMIAAEKREKQDLFNKLRRSEVTGRRRNNRMIDTLIRAMNKRVWG